MHCIQERDGKRNVYGYANIYEGNKVKQLEEPYVENTHNRYVTA